MRSPDPLSEGVMKLDHMVLLVGSLDASLPYYAALLPLLGFTKSRDHVYGNDDGFYLDLKQAKEIERGYSRYGVGLNHFGVVAPDRATVDAVATRMRALGFAAPDAQVIDEDYALFMKDPDGMRIEVVSYGAQGSRAT